MSDHDRFVPLSTVFNLRDFGGYDTTDGQRVRRRRLYRGDCPAHVAGADRTLLDSLGIRMVVDLRRPAEVARAGAACPTRTASPTSTSRSTTTRPASVGTARSRPTSPACTPTATWT